MRQRILLLSMAGCLAFGMSAQLEVIGNGSVQVGSFADGGPSTPGPSPLGISVGTGSDIDLSLSDTTATLGINGTGKKLSGGKISFGVGNVNIQEYGIGTGSAFSTLMRLNSKRGGSCLTAATGRSSYTTARTRQILSPTR